MPNADNATGRHSARILCLDPDPVGNRVLTQFAGNSGYATRSATTVSEALDVLRRETIDVIITRYPAPTQQGSDLTTLLRSEGIKTPVLVLPTDTDRRDGGQLSEESAVRFAAQPIDFAALDNAIRMVLADGRQSVLDYALRAAARPRSGAWPTDRVNVTLDSLNVAEAERRLIAEALARCGYNRTAAAELLGMHVRTLRRKLKAMRLDASTETRSTELM